MKQLSILDYLFYFYMKLMILNKILGNIPPEQRYLAWHKYRVFFLTPQVLANDLSLNKCPSDTFRCVIVDEAHRATKDYAYVQVNY